MLLISNPNPNLTLTRQVVLSVALVLISKLITLSDSRIHILCVRRKAWGTIFYLASNNSRKVLGELASGNFGNGFFIPRTGAAQSEKRWSVWVSCFSEYDDMEE